MAWFRTKQTNNFNFLAELIYISTILPFLNFIHPNFIKFALTDQLIFCKIFIFTKMMPNTTHTNKNATILARSVICQTFPSSTGNVEKQLI